MRYFSSGETSILYNTSKPQIDLTQALSSSQIVYFQLPTMMYPFLGRVTGNLVLQGLQSAISTRHLTESSKYCSIVLDDFQDYIYEGFVGILNKARSANIGVVFSHQAIGDLEQVSKSFANRVLSNTNVKIILRANDPDTCDYFAKMFGTIDSTKTTRREIHSILGPQATGEGSVREVKEYRIHPDTIKNLPTGQAIISVPLSMGVKVQHVHLSLPPALNPVHLPSVDKSGNEQYAGATPSQVCDVD